MCRSSAEVEEMKTEELDHRSPAEEEPEPLPDVGVERDLRWFEDLTLEKIVEGWPRVGSAQGRHPCRKRRPSPSSRSEPSTWPMSRPRRSAWRRTSASTWRSPG